jgi:hypothetical protein
MKLTKKLFSKMGDVKAHLYKCSILFVLAVLVVVPPMFFQDHDLPNNPATYTAEKALKIYSNLGNDTVVTRVKKGEVLTVYAYRPASESHMQPSLWVQTANGVRGFLHIVDTDIPVVAWNESSETLDTIKVTGFDDSGVYDKYICKFSDGTKAEVNLDDIRPLLPDSFTRKVLANNNNVYMSLQKFEREYIGSTYAENDEKFRPALHTAISKGNMCATYPITVIDTKTGLRHKPVVTYDITGKAVSYEWASKNSNTQWITKNFPGLRYIVDNPVVGRVINSSMFDYFSWMSMDDIGDDTIDSALKFVLAILILIPCLMWFFLPPLIPTVLIGILLHKRQVFKGIGNRNMILILFVITLASLYLWLGIMYAWGMFDFVGLVNLYIVVKTFFMVFRIFSFRCYVCGGLETMDYKGKEVLKQYKQWRPYAKMSKVLSESKNKWRSWTRTTRTYSDGHKEVSDHDYQTHVDTTTTALYDDYEILFLITEERHWHKCNICGEEKYYDFTDFKELDRRDTGQHVETRTTTT